MKMAKTGRPPIPAYLKVLRGNPDCRPIQEEVQPEKPPSIPEPPVHLDQYACEEWKRISPECYHLRLLTTLDVQSLAAYCMAYSRWRTAEEILASIGARDPKTRGMLVKGSCDQPIQNPMLMIARTAAREMVRYAGEFGLTPAARARIAAGALVDKTAGKFDGFLAG
jgi:P27 family predicted phage terminase small subunit